MLSTIRNKSKGWVAYLIVGLITVPFALFGINEYFTGTSNVVVAVVDDDEIMQDIFLSEFNSQKRRIQEQLGDQYDPQIDNLLKQSTIENIVNKRLLSQLAVKLGYATATGELQMTIQANDLFHTDGNFSMEKYQQILRLNGYDTATYESIRLKELTQNQIKYNLLNSSFVTSSELDRLQKINDQERLFSYIQIDANDYLNNASVNINDIEKYYNENKSSFIEPQQVRVDFIELSVDEIAKEISVSEDDLTNLYEDEQERFATEEERKAQHILVETEEIANEVISLMNNGSSFAELAKSYSIDTGSSEIGGDLGYFTKGVMVPEFESTVFSMKEGQLSPPIQSEFGYHIIKLNSINASTLKSFDSVHSELVELATQRAAQQELYNYADQLTNLSYEFSLIEAAGQLGLTIQESELFNQSSTEYDKSFIKAAFSDVVLSQGENSEVIEIDADRSVVLSLNEKIAKRQKDLEEVSDQIESHLTNIQAKSFVDDLAIQAVKLLSNSDQESAKSFMTDNNMTWVESGWVKRNSQSPSPEIVSIVFALPKTDKGAPTYSSQSINDRLTVVFRLSEVKTSDIEPNIGLGRAVLGFESDEVFKSILESIKSNTEVKIFSERL
jgi:peptidyl-prolyl cis-trans isomerase D